LKTGRVDRRQEHVQEIFEVFINLVCCFPSNLPALLPYRIPLYKRKYFKYFGSSNKTRYISLFALDIDRSTWAVVFGGGILEAPPLTVGKLLSRPMPDGTCRPVAIRNNARRQRADA
jgi:hypothetical protein